MSELEPIVPQTPVDVIEPFAYDLIFDKSFDEFSHSNKETAAVRQLNEVIRDFDMLGQYKVRANLAYRIPENPETDEDGNVTITRMDKETEFDGMFMGGRTLKIGRILEEHSTRAVCLAFHKVLIRYRTSVENVIVPKRRILSDEDRMFVPVFAVNHISRLD